MICADVISSGGVNTLAVTSSTTCEPGQVVLLSVADYQQLINSPFNLSLADGASIASAVLLVWALGFGVRMLIRTLSADSGSDSAASE